MGARLQRFLRSAPAHDERPRPHAAGNDAQLAASGPNGAFAGHEDRLAEVLLLGHVVVVALHRRPVQRERRQQPPQRGEDARHHQAPVLQGVALRPGERVDVVREVLHPFLQVGEVLGRQAGEVPFHVALRELREVAPQHVAHAAAAGVEHHPDPVRLVQAHLDEVVAAAERAELPRPLAANVADHLPDPLVTGQDPLEAGPQRIEHVPVRDRLPVGGEADGDRLFNRLADRAQRVGEPGSVEREPRGAHPAADVDADRGRDQRAPGRDHRTDRRPDADVHVGHRRHVTDHDRQPRDRGELLDGRLVDVVGEDPDRDAAPLEHLPHRHD